jgi:hypothetical protein
MLQRLIRARLDPRVSGGPPRILPRSRASFSGSPGSAAAASCAETQTAATGIEPLGPPVLDGPAARLAAMV